MADINKLKQALSEYTGDADSLNRFVEVATAELGDNWAESIYETLTDLSAEEKERLDHAFQYYAATTAWNEAQAYLAQETPLDTNLMAERIPVLEHWLTFFQDAGAQVIEQLKQKAAGETPENISDSETKPDEENPDDMAPSSEETVDVPPFEEKKQSETLWAVDKIQKQAEMTKEVQAWVAARCVALGNREVFAYPYYGFVVDVMRQTRKDIQGLLENEEMLREINEAYPGKVRELQDYQVSLDKDIEVAAQNGLSDETALISDELTGEDARRLLGQLDTSNTPEFSGPAPDGFEVVLDTDEELDDKKITEEYNQIENTLLSDQIKNQAESEKKTSQTPQNSVKKKLSFSLGNKKPVGT